MTHELLPALIDRYGVDAKRLPRSTRSDWTVPASTALVASAVEAPDWIAQLRAFFMAMDAEVEQYRDDPIATGQALARVDALLADLRSLRASLNTATAESMGRYGIRRLTISSVATLEASSTYDRHAWRSDELLPVVLRALGIDLGINTETGEQIDADDIAVRLLAILNPSWKLTGLRGLDIDPDQWCDFTSDDTGQPAKVPTARFIDNAVRSPHLGVQVKVVES